MYLATPPTANTAGVCGRLNKCVAGVEYERAAPTPTTDRKCALLMACDPAAEYERAAPTPTTDRACALLTTCGPVTEYERDAPTATTDRACAATKADGTECGGAGAGGAECSSGSCAGGRCCGRRGKLPGCLGCDTEGDCNICSDWCVDAAHAPAATVATPRIRTGRGAARWRARGCGPSPRARSGSNS